MQTGKEKAIRSTWRYIKEEMPKEISDRDSWHANVYSSLFDREETGH